MKEMMANSMLIVTDTWYWKLEKCWPGSGSTLRPQLRIISGFEDRHYGNVYALKTTTISFISEIGIKFWERRYEEGADFIVEEKSNSWWVRIVAVFSA